MQKIAYLWRSELKERERPSKMRKKKREEALDGTISVSIRQERS
jgi:hypothetical protein